MANFNSKIINLAIFSPQWNDAHKEMSRAVGVKKPQEAHKKSGALEKMKAAKNCGEEYYGPTRECKILGRNKTRLTLLEEHLKNPIVALDKALKWVEKTYRGLGPSAWWKGVSQWRALAFSKFWKNDLERHLAPLGSHGLCVFAHNVHGM